MSVALLKSNPYLREPSARRIALRISAANSSAVEGVRKPFADPQPVIKKAPISTRGKPAE